MPIWLQAVFSIAVLASLLFIITGSTAVIKSRGRLLRPWLLVAVGAITLFNVYQLTAPIPPKPDREQAAAPAQ
ncbi:MAG: hypothetical protein AAF607_01965 [Pseudomonadota bacterium]